MLVMDDSLCYLTERSINIFSLDLKSTITKMITDPEHYKL